MFSNEDYLADLLAEAGLVSADQISYARNSLSGRETLIEHLLATTHLSQEDVAHTLAVNAGVPYVKLTDFTYDLGITETISDDVARRYRVIPVLDDGLYLTVAVIDPLDFEMLDSLPHVIGREINIVCATPKDIDSHLSQIYGVDIAKKDASNDLTITTGDAEAGADGDDAPIIRLVFQTLTEAFRLRASDIHIEPLETSVRIRYRLDGKLVEVDNHPKKLLPAVIARLKVMSGTMSIAEKRLPQDGRIQLKMGEKEVDLRVSSVPSNHGESIVMRILDKTALLLGLPELGFFSDDQTVFENLLGLPDGILLVTGPTGSGKTTTLYACLNVINRPDKKIITVEDPVEYELPGINQVMVKADIGMTFAAALRAMLRQAPNIIMIGEIRDFETAEIAIRASLTGHLVFSTLHTNDAGGAVTRLLDMGVEPFLVASSLEAVVAQRLVRRLCPACKRPVKDPDLTFLRSVGFPIDKIEGATLHEAAGCEKCRMTGFRGRTGLYELLTITEGIEHLILQRSSSNAIKQKAVEEGMLTLRDDGWSKVLEGMTTVEEVVRVSEEAD